MTDTRETPSPPPTPTCKPSATTGTIAARGAAGAPRRARKADEPKTIRLQTRPGARLADLWVRATLIDLIPLADDEDAQMAFSDEMHDVCNDLAGPNPSPVERMLAEVATAAWMTLRIHEARYADAVNRATLSAMQSSHQQDRIVRANRRLMSVLKTLAVVRKLAVSVPSVTVNVAQVNGASPAPAPAASLADATPVNALPTPTATPAAPVGGEPTSETITHPASADE